MKEWHGCCSSYTSSTNPWRDWKKCRKRNSGNLSPARSWRAVLWIRSRSSMRLPPFWRPSKCTIQCRKAPDLARQDLARRDLVRQDKPVCPAPRFLGIPKWRWERRGVRLLSSGAMFGESDTLKRSDTATVTWLLNLSPDAGQQSRPDNAANQRSSRPLLQTPQCRIIFLDHSSRHQAAFVFRDNDFIGARVANRVCVALLAGARDDLCLGIQRAGSDRDVKIVGVAVDHDANPARPFNS